jgi:hypothetical protein
VVVVTVGAAAILIVVVEDDVPVPLPDAVTGALVDGADAVGAVFVVGAVDGDAVAGAVFDEVDGDGDGDTDAGACAVTDGNGALTDA